MTFISLLLPLIGLFQPAGGAKFSAKLYAAVDAIQPGGRTELAVQIEVEKGWHVYHPIILDTGAPTAITFDLPAGATVGPLRFPTPYLAKEYELQYLALAGRFAVLTTLTLAPDAGSEPLTVKAHVFALACKQLCIPVQAEASLTLKVSTETPAPANQELFKNARSQLPRPLAEADYIEGSRLVLSHTRIPVGGKAELVAVIRVRDGYHITDRNPGLEGFAPSRLFIEARDGVNFGHEAQVWPEPQTRQVAGLGRLREHSGQVIIRAPLVIDDAEFPPGPVRLGVLFRYQPCRDGAACSEPAMAAGAVEFEVVPAGEPAAANPDPILAQVPALPAQGSGSARQMGRPGGPGQLPLPLVFVFAFVGGAILNIMPCVLPVISLKIFGFVQQAGDQPGRIFRMGLLYAAGILASFVLIAIVMVGFGLAWGGFMQRPAVLIGLAAVVFAFALSLLGVFEIQLPGTATDAAGVVAAHKGYVGAFFNGVMTTVLATPCVGPFLGTAIGVLSTLPWQVAGSGIMVVGLGLATPYVLLTAFPAWLRYLPKPGPWMVTFKQIVGFILVFVVLWVLSILAQIADTSRILGALGLLGFVGVGCWVVGRITLSSSAGRVATLWIVAVVLVAGGGWASFRVFGGSSSIPWQPWQPGLAERLAEQGYTVYVDYTATWCLTCQANKKLVLESDRVAREFERLGIYPVKADFTGYNPEIQKELQKYGRNGVPLNIVLPADHPGDAIVLPELLTPGMVLDAIQQAGPSRTKPSFWFAGG